MSLHLFHLMFFLYFCCQFVTACFVVDLLKRIVVSFKVSLFISFRVGSSNTKVSSDRNRVIISNYVRPQYATDMES